MTDRWEPHDDTNRWTDEPPFDDDAPRYRQPPFDPTGEHGPRHFEDCTVTAQHRYLNGPRYGHLFIFHVYERRSGPWFASFDGSRWCRADAPGAVEPVFDGIGGFEDEEGEDDA